jgi:N,N-dimethylformamidase
MYLGGNGFYWNTVYHPTKPGVIEVRRTEDGTRAWRSEAGESHHAFNGEYGGLWQRKGRPPNRLVGVGFTAQGFDVSSHYRRRDASTDPRAAFIFEGIDEDIIGNFGYIGDGAAGEEIDRFDKRLGSPSHALVLATSENHSATYMVTKEELFSNIPGTSGLESPMVRADMVFFETPGGGAVFSTGSIAWAASLPFADCDNNVARLSQNVLRRFLDPESFELPVAGSA